MALPGTAALHHRSPSPSDCCCLPALPLQHAASHEELADAAMLWWLFQVVAAMSILEPLRDILFCWVQPTSQCATYLGCSGASCLVTSRGMLLLAAVLFLWGSWVQEPGRMVKLVVPERQGSAAQMHRVGTPHGLPACLPAAWCRLHCFSRCACCRQARPWAGRPWQTLRRPSQICRRVCALHVEACMLPHSACRCKPAPLRCGR